MSLLSDTLAYAVDFSLDNKKLVELMSKHLLDDQFCSLTELSQTISLLEPSFRDNDNEWHTLLVQAQKNIDQQLDGLLRFYVNCFEKENLYW